MNKCCICHKESRIQYICPICNKEYCEGHIYSHFCSTNFDNTSSIASNFFFVKSVFSSLFYWIKNQLSSMHSCICFCCIIIYFLSFIFQNLVSEFYFIPSISYIIFEPWRIITYMFVHGSFIHLIFNLIALNLFGSLLEPHVGKKRFLYLYLFCGIISALTHFFFSVNPLIGASGSIFGLLSICSFIHPNITIFINFIPIKLKYSIILFIIFDLFSGLFIQDHIAHFAHLGGLIFGLIIGYFLVLEGFYE